MFVPPSRLGTRTVRDSASSAMSWIAVDDTSGRSGRSTIHFSSSNLAMADEAAADSPFPGSGHTSRSSRDAQVRVSEAELTTTGLSPAPRIAETALVARFRARAPRSSDPRMSLSRDIPRKSRMGRTTTRTGAHISRRGDSALVPLKCKRQRDSEGEINCRKNQKTGEELKISTRPQT